MAGSMAYARGQFSILHHNRVHRGETMKNRLHPILKLSFIGIVAAILILAAFPSRALAQQNAAPSSPTASPASSTVPQIIQFNGQLSGTPGGAPVPSGTVSVTFTLFEN